MVVGPRKRLRALAVFAVAAIAATACSSSSKSQSAPSNTTAASAGSGTAATGTPLNLGFTATFGTPVADYTTTLAAAKAAIRAINASGGVNGHPLVLKNCNNQFDANASAACARQFVSDGIVAQVGSVAPFGEQQISQVLAPAGIPQIGDNAFAQWLTASNEFPILLYLPGVYADLAACSQLGYDKVAIAGAETSLGTGFAAILQGVAAKLPNIKIVAGNNGRIILSSTATDVSSQAQQLISSGANCIDLSAVFPNQQILLLKAMEALGAPATTKVIWGAAAITPQQVNQIPDLAAKYAITTSMWPNLAGVSQYKTIAQFVSELRAEASSGDTNVASTQGTSVIRDADFQTWISIHAAAVVMAQEKAYTASALLAALKSGATYNLGDLLPAWNPVAAGTKTFPRLPESNYWVLGYKNGTPVQLSQLLPNPIDAKPYIVETGG